jgi:adenine-specific DNA-methyltransferase
MTFRYIGSKSRLVDQIMARVGPRTDGFFVDAFCGTGAVAEAAALAGWPVRVNDNLHSAVISTVGRLVSRDQAMFKKLGGYATAIEKLNACEASDGFIWRAYSPASVHFCGFERRYFTEENAARIDAMRWRIREWSEEGSIDATEEQLLIADLFSALNRVANIAGTFGCFLAKWTNQAKEPIALRARELKAQSVAVETSVGDVFDVQADRSDVVYLDPPYTKRQYASYYHILETVALGDEPEVEGVAGLRPWKDRASDFCYKTRALATLSRLINALQSERILLSYSSEGHVPTKELRTELAKIGSSVMHPLGEIGRYRPNQVASDAASNVKEYLVVVAKQITEREPLRRGDFADRVACA